MSESRNPLVNKLVDRAKSLGTPRRVLDLMIPYWEKNTPTLEEHIRDRMLSPPPDGPPPLEFGTLEDHMRHRMRLPRLEGDKE